MKSKEGKASRVRNFVFGVEDSLVSTVGLLSGVAIAGLPKTDIIITGVVLIFVEAFSMGIGALLSERAAGEYVTHRTEPITKSFQNGFIMFGSYFVSGFIPLAPYLFFRESWAVLGSIIISLIALFVLGLFRGYFSGVGSVRKGFEMLLIGGLAIILGVIVGWLIG